MKAEKWEKWIAVGLIITMGLVVLGLLGFRLLSRFDFWPFPVMAAESGRRTFQNDYGCDGQRYDMGRVMIGGGWQNSRCEGDTFVPMLRDDLPSDDVLGITLTLEEASDILDQYLVKLNDDNLEIAEVMEFENNFYAIVREEETSMGAMELLVEKGRGTVIPEMGPNMMWNTKYGMHRRGMMGRWIEGENNLSEDEVLRIAREWLDDNTSMISIDEHADPFYGYYTIHTLKAGAIEGMLSVHATTGQVWYHSWHGDFIQMLEGEDTH